MRIGVIGVGRIGTLHARNLAARAELVLTDANREAATGLAGELGATVAADAGALLDSGLDGVVIASSTDTHPALLRAAMERDLPAFCEKPVAMTLAEATTLARLEADRDARVQIGFQRRWDLGYRRAQQAVHTGELGVIHTIRATTLDNNPPPAANIARSGGIFADMCVHDFDIVRFVSVADGLAAIRIAVACQESLNRGVVVELAGLT
ncbi:MAG: Gfo/Idh/MocA family oxidoreductase [Micropruina sp.]|nr:Gfo/Idh/MocA family oxidoreductase [Micropruina sp.]